MRARIDVKHEAFQKASTTANISGTAFDNRVKEKRQLVKNGREATTKLAVYIENAFLDNAAKINHRLLLDLKYPTDDQELGGYLRNVCSTIDNHDNATYPLPAAFTDPIYTVRAEFDRALRDVTDFFEDRRTAIQTRNKAMAEFKALLKPIRMWLWQMLPQGRRDTRLIGYGFTPYGTRHEKVEE